jgi:cysteine desulfurase
VLTALGLDAEVAATAVRFGLGRWTTAEEIEYAVKKMTQVVTSLRAQRASLRPAAAGGAAGR